MGVPETRDCPHCRGTGVRPFPAQAGRTYAALEPLGWADHLAVAAAMGCPAETARSRLDALTMQGLAETRREGRGMRQWRARSTGSTGSTPN